MAIAMRDGLATHGIGSVQLLNEIPMNPGYTFGARSWAEILVREADLPKALEVVAELEQSLNGEATSQPYPPALSLRPSTCPIVVWISMLVLLPAFNAVNLALVIGLIHLNQRCLRRATLAALVGLLAMPVILGWLIITAVLCVIRAAISLSKPDKPVEKQREDAR